MSSPVTPMTPVTPPPRRQRRRSFAGPVVLIILGVVFLLGNLHMLAWKSLGYALVNLGKAPEAVAALRKYLELAPKAEDEKEVKEMIDMLAKSGGTR